MTMVQGNLFAEEEFDDGAREYVLWIKSFCRTIEQALKGKPGQAGGGYRGFIGGWLGGKKLKARSFAIQINGEAREYSLEEWWQKA